MNVLENLIDTLQTHGLEFFRVYYGEYRGIVADNKDPEKRGRIKVILPQFDPKKKIDVWIDPAGGSIGQSRGVFNPPELNDCVWVRFDRGKPDAILSYSGSFPVKEDVPPELMPGSDGTPYRRGFVSRMGHAVVFDDTPGQEAITLLWHEAVPGDSAFNDPGKAADRSKGEHHIVRFDKSGILLRSLDGAIFQMDAANHQMKLFAPRTKNGSADQIVLGDGGIRIIDHTGSVSLFINDGQMSVTANKGIVFQTPDVTLESTGTNLSSGPREPVIMGDRYTTSRYIMHSTIADFFTEVGGAAKATAVALQGQVATLAGGVASALIPFFELLSIGAIRAGAALRTFEASRDAYLSKKTKTG